MFESLRDSRPAYSHGLWVSITISQFHGVMYRFLKARECSNFQRSQFVLFCLCLGPLTLSVPFAYRSQVLSQKKAVFAAPLALFPGGQKTP